MRRRAVGLFMAVLGYSAPALAGEMSSTLKVGVTITGGAQSTQSRLTTRKQSRTTQVSRVGPMAPPAQGLSTISLIYK